MKKISYPVGYWTLFILFLGSNVAGSIYWVTRNVVPIGRDAGGHLARTLEYTELLHPFSHQALFHALTYHNYRPPLFYLAVQPFYKLFSYSMDSAQGLNILLLCLVLLLTYLLGCQIGGKWVGLGSMILTGFFPQIAAMSRLFYLELAVTTWVLINLLTLLWAQDFTKRLPSLCWGISLGCGLLVKWTFPIYVILPTLYIIWRSRAVRPTQWESINIKSVDRKKLFLSMIGAMLITALWFWPNQARLFSLPGGHWLWLLWLISLTMLFYIGFQKPFQKSSQKSSPSINLSLAVLVSLLLASHWYVARLDFWNSLIEAAFGTYGGNYEAANPFSFQNYLRPARTFISQHVGTPIAILLGAPTLAAWLWLWYRGRFRLIRAFWLPILSLIGAYGILALLSQEGERNLVPLLPMIAFICVIGLKSYPRALAIGLAGLWCIFMGTQWSLYTFDTLADLHERSAGFWAKSEFLVRPASGMTDRAYWVAPDVLEKVVAHTSDNEIASLGFLVNSPEIHRSPFRYLLAAAQLNGKETGQVEIMSLVEREDRGWGGVFANQWILVKDGDNHDVEQSGLEAIDRLFTGDPLFDAYYRIVKQYPLPNGEMLSLFQRSQGPGHPLADPDRVDAAAPITETINRWWHDDVTLVIPTPELAIWLGIHDLQATRILLPDPDTSLDDLDLQSSKIIFVVSDYATSAVQDWFEERYLSSTKIGNDLAGFTVYGVSGHKPEPISVSEQSWITVDGTDDVVKLIALYSWPTAQVGQVLPVELYFNGAVTDGSLKISVRLLGPDGTKVAQEDKVLSEVLRVWLFLPSNLPAGNYSLAGVVYDSITGRPLVGSGGVEEVRFGQVTVYDR